MLSISEHRKKLNELETKFLNDIKTGDNWYLRKAKKNTVKCNLRTFENSKSMVNSLKMFKLLGYGFNAGV